MSKDEISLIQQQITDMRDSSLACLEQFGIKYKRQLETMFETAIQNGISAITRAYQDAQSKLDKLRISTEANLDVHNKSLIEQLNRRMAESGSIKDGIARSCSTALSSISTAQSKATDSIDSLGNSFLSRIKDSNDSTLSQSIKSIEAAGATFLSSMDSKQNTTFSAIQNLADNSVELLRQEFEKLKHDINATIKDKIIEIQNAYSKTTEMYAAVKKSEKEIYETASWVKDAGVYINSIKNMKTEIKEITEEIAVMKCRG